MNPWGPTGGRCHYKNRVGQKQQPGRTPLPDSRSEGTNRERVIIVGRVEPDESLRPTLWSEGLFRDVFERFWFPGSYQAPAGFLA